MKKIEASAKICRENDAVAGFADRRSLLFVFGALIKSPLDHPRYNPRPGIGKRLNPPHNPRPQKAKPGL